jgi:ribosomal protein L40E
MFCQKCNARNEDDKKFCGECGVKLEPRPDPIAVEGQEGAYYCSRHPKNPTLIRCGRCETPICQKCVALRPRGVAHEVAKGVSNVANSGRGFWLFSLWAMILRFISNLFGGRWF